MSADAISAAALWGGAVTKPLTLRENEVFEVALPQGRAALRLHRMGYQTAAAIHSELWWCAELGKAGLPVPAPIALPDGGLLAQLPSGRHASVVTWVKGEPLGAAGVPLPGPLTNQLDRHHALGRLVAQIHRATDALTLPATFNRPAWGHDGLVGANPFWGRFWDHPALSGDEAATLRATRDWLSQRLRTSASPIGLIHADVLRENVFVNGQSLSLIDFDDSGFGYRWYDLGTVLSQNLYEPAYPEIRAALIDGYATILPIDPNEVDSFTLARTLASVGWTAPRLPPDSPIHRSHIQRALMMASWCLA
jgi:Ser/Thr protein kinase RdoA (MazF antagonist)